MITLICKLPTYTMNAFEEKWRQKVISSIILYLEGFFQEKFIYSNHGGEHTVSNSIPMNKEIPENIHKQISAIIDGHMLVQLEVFK